LFTFLICNIIRKLLNNN